MRTKNDIKFIQTGQCLQVLEENRLKNLKEKEEK